MSSASSRAGEKEINSRKGRRGRGKKEKKHIYTREKYKRRKKREKNRAAVSIITQGGLLKNTIYRGKVHARLSATGKTLGERLIVHPLLILSFSLHFHAHPPSVPPCSTKTPVRGLRGRRISRRCTAAP